MGIRILGLIKADNRFAKLESGLIDACGKTAEEGVKKTYWISQIQVPRKTNALAKSGRLIELQPRTSTSRSHCVKYGYDTPDSSEESVLDYAAAVHEILKASHTPPTKAKYVEDPLIQNISQYKKDGIENAKQAVLRAFK